jgi:hypothetical protein
MELRAVGLGLAEERNTREREVVREVGGLGECEHDVRRGERCPPDVLVFGGRATALAEEVRRDNGARDSHQEALQRQDPSTLVSVLLELAQDHEAVRSRLERLQLADRPDKLAAGFRETLTAWRRSSKFFTYREAGEFGRTLQAWLDQVDRELLPKDPAAALALFESFIEVDGAF